MDIKVTTTNVTIDQESLNKGEYNIRECNFDLVEEFTGLVCKALFTVKSTNLTYEQDIVHNKCTIPYEATEHEGNVIVGVIAYEIEDNELVKRYSPFPDEFFVSDGSYIEDIENQSTPTPSELEQLEQRVSAIEIDASQVETNTQDIANIKLEQTTQNNDISSLQTGKADKSEIPDVSGLVSDTDYATSSKGGVVKTGAGLSLNVNGTTIAETKTYVQYNNSGNELIIGKGTLENVITGKNLETATNKVTSLSSLSTDTEYPTAKCVYDYINAQINSAIGGAY